MKRHRPILTTRDVTVLIAALMTTEDGTRKKAYVSLGEGADRDALVDQADEMTLLRGRLKALVTPKPTKGTT
ncbi:MAG: hypothetical protein GY937_22935 [bacterium]|nr:hypothetical protein [bacterium]